MFSTLSKRIHHSIAIAKRTVKAAVIDRKNTFCPILWDSLYINQHGDIFTCCHEKPSKLGNIYRQDLKTIWEKSIFLRIHRAAARRNGLYCFADCTILSPSLKQSPPQKPVVLPYPRKLWILYGEACNLHCRMCWQDHNSRIRLNNDVLKKIDWPQVESVELQGGEILAMKDAREMYLWLTQKMKRKVNIITNGLLINDEWAEHLVRGSKKITISVNAAIDKTHELINCGSSFQQVMSNIRKLIAMKSQAGHDVEIWFKFTIVPENILEIPDAIEVAKSLGCDWISYGFSSEVPAFFQRHEDVRQELKKSLSRFIENKQVGIHIELGHLDQLGLH